MNPSPRTTNALNGSISSSPPPQTKKGAAISNTITKIQNGYKVLIILRGLPGSGKSTLARTIIDNSIGGVKHYNDHIFSADGFFIRNGVYVYDPTLISEAHAWCRNNSFKAMARDISPIIIDNTNTQIWEMKPYAEEGVARGYIVEVLEPDCWWFFKPAELARKNTHGVPKDKIKSMSERYEKNITSAKLLSMYKLEYSEVIPQIRKHPYFNAQYAETQRSSRVVPPEPATYSSPRYDDMRNNGPEPTYSRASTTPNREVAPEPTSTSRQPRRDSNSAHKTIDDYIASSNVWNVDDNALRSFQHLVNNNAMSNGTSQRSTRSNGTPERSTRSNETLEKAIRSNGTPERAARSNDTPDRAGRSNNTPDRPARSNATPDRPLMSNEGQQQGENALTNNSWIWLTSNAWGTDEKALNSWEIVPTGNVPRLSASGSTTEQVVKTNSSTNTVDYEFNINRLSTVPDGFKVITAHDRDINSFRANVVQPKNGMLDKGSATDEIVDVKAQLRTLKACFSKIPLSHIKFIYSSCSGNLDMITEILSETNFSDADTNSDISDDLDADNMETNTEEVVEVIKSSDEELIDLDAPKNSPLRTRKSKAVSSEESQKVKSLLESKFVNPPAPTSKFVNSPNKISSPANKFNSPSKFVDSSDNFNTPNKFNSSGKVFTPPVIDRSTKPKNLCEPSTSTAGPSQNNMILGTINIDPEPDEDDSSSISSKTDSPMETDEEVQTMELNLGDNFVEQLEKEFGDPDIIYPKGYQPVIQLPKSLARQLYAFYVESVFSQMDAQNEIMEQLTSEDENFARKIDLERTRTGEIAGEQTVNFKEIMTEQMEISLHQKKMEEWRNLTPNDMAARLTRKKLFETFPKIAPELLEEMLFAHDNNYKQTLETLLANVDPNDIKGDGANIQVAPVTEELITEMNEAQEGDVELFGTDRRPQDYRDEAQKHLKKRKDLYQKAQKYYQAGMYEVAMYFGEQATKQTRIYEQANNMAATAFLDEHSKRLQDFNTLDLHYLFVKEAIPALDVFVDRNIHLLRGGGKNTQELMVITGRGNRSKNRVSKIKPAVISRLRTRKIWFVELNAGLLKIKVNTNCKSTSELEQSKSADS